jgi:hypothetical protein
LKLEISVLGKTKRTERMSRPAEAGSQRQVRRLRSRLAIRVINHCERTDALVDDILQGVTKAEGHLLYDPEESTRQREPISPNNHGCGHME